MQNLKPQSRLCGFLLYQPFLIFAPVKEICYDIKTGSVFSRGI